ncbi:MAG: hypothetical protein JST27_11640, partial [Bacteroidetes bacterium]|nr:hypothetical protein [Bacteroidota bacterium]
MRKLLILLSLGIWLNPSASAQTYFNKRETLHSFNSFIASVKEINNAYYSFSTCIDSINDLGNGLKRNLTAIRMSIWDKNGRIILDSLYQRGDRPLYATANSSTQLDNNEIVFPVTANDTTGPIHPAKLELLCFDSSGHFEWIKEYEKPFCPDNKLGSDYWAVVDIKPDGYGNWLILSNYQCGVRYKWGYVQSVLTKLDSNFNVIWHKQYGDLKNNSMAGHLLVEPGGYCFISQFSNANRVQKNFVCRAEIFWTDTAGNQIKTWMSDSSKLIFGGKDLIRTRDGGLVYCGSGDGIENPTGDGEWGNLYARPWIEKLDSSGNVLWSHSFSSTSDSLDTYASGTESCLSRVIELPDGDLMVAGQILKAFDADSSYYRNYGVLLRLAGDGTVKWKRRYTYQGDTLDYSINDMQRTTDGGYIMAGMAYDSHGRPETLPWQRAWLLKVDSNGCTSANDPQCWPVRVSETPVPKTEAYQVFPNPVTSMLQIQYHQQGKSVFTLYEM